MDEELTSARAGVAPVSGVERMLQALRRRIALVVLCALVGAGAALALSLGQQKEYTATSLVLMRDPALDQKLFSSTFFTNTDPVREAATSLRLADLTTIAQRVASRPGIPLTPAQVSAAVSASEDQSNVLTFNARAAHPQLAATLANVYAQEYKAFRQDSDRAQIVQAADLVRQQLQRLSPTEQQAEDGRALRNHLQQLQTLAAVQTGGMQVAQLASVPSAPSSPRPKRDAILGGFFGLFIGLALAALLEQLDRRLRTPEDVIRTLGYALLGLVPNSPTLRSRPWQQEHVDASACEAFRLLRETLRFFQVDSEAVSNCILVTSGVASEGKTTVAWGLAAAAASVGERALLVEADFRGPSLSQPALTELASRLRRSSGRPTGRGLAAPQTIDGTLDKWVVHFPLPAGFEGLSDALDVLVAGAAAPNPIQLLESQRMRELIDEARRRYDFVVIDSPPVTTVADALPLIDLVDGVVVIARLDITTRSSAASLRQQLQTVSAPVTGVVINGTVRGDAYAYADPRVAASAR